MIGEILVPVSSGTEEMELVIVVDLLRRAGLRVLVAGEFDIITCSRSIKIIPDVLINDIAEDELYTAIVLIGGMVGVQNLLDNSILIAILTNNKKNGVLLTAICAAPIILSSFGLIEGDTKITSHYSVKNELSHYNYSDERVVLDSNIITSNGAGTAFDFAFAIINQLKNKDISEKIKKEIMF